jgi:hypothetical protein
MSLDIASDLLNQNSSLLGDADEADLVRNVENLKVRHLGKRMNRHWTGN